MLNIKILYISDKMSCKKERTDESMASENITLYIKGDRNVEVTEQDVFLKDIVSMECSDKKFLPKLQTVKILKLHGNREQRYVVSVLEIIACIHAAYPEVEVQNLGEADIIVTYENQKTPPYLWHILKVAVVAAIIFLARHFQSWHLIMMWVEQNCLVRYMNL